MRTFLERYKGLSPGTDLVGASLTNYKLGRFHIHCRFKTQTIQHFFWLASFLWPKKIVEARLRDFALLLLA